jgi:hypothetical protein
MGTFKTQKMAQMRATSWSAVFQGFKRWTKQDAPRLPDPLVEANAAFGAVVEVR